jgi:3-methylcrotonyl-CoA carboxylase alpha subunit
MKRRLNGKEVELPDNPTTPVRKRGNRLMVQTPTGTVSAVAVRVGDTVHLSIGGRTAKVERIRAHRAGEEDTANGSLVSPLPGQVVAVNAANGDHVEAGDKILVLEAMKMQQALVAPFAGTVTHLSVQPGDKVTEGQLLARVEAHPESE